MSATGVDWLEEILLALTRGHSHKKLPSMGLELGSLLAISLTSMFRDLIWCSPTRGPRAERLDTGLAMLHEAVLAQIRPRLMQYIVHTDPHAVGRRPPNILHVFGPRGLTATHMPVHARVDWHSERASSGLSGDVRHRNPA